MLEARRTDLIFVDKKAKSCVIIDVTIPGDCRIREKEIEKIEKYQNLKRELKRLWSLKKVEVVPVVVEALGCISNVQIVQKSVLEAVQSSVRQQNIPLLSYVFSDPSFSIV